MFNIEFSIFNLHEYIRIRVVMLMYIICRAAQHKSVLKLKEW